jgi:glutathione S-transferase
VQKSLIAAAYNDVAVELPAFDFEKDLKSAAFKLKSASGKVPVLETPHGFIFESGAIARYIARLRSDTNLLGASNFQQGQVDQWIDFVANEVEPARGIWLYPIQGYLAFNEKAYTEAKKELASALTVLNTHLHANTYLVGNAVTLADITLVTALGTYAQRHMHAPSHGHRRTHGGLHLVVWSSFNLESNRSRNQDLTHRHTSHSMRTHTRMSPSVLCCSLLSLLCLASSLLC